MFTMVHIGVETFGIMDTDTLMVRNILVLSVLGILLALATRRETLLEQRTRETEERETALQRQLQQVRTMEALGTLAGGVAHDFNNILLAIIGYSELARENTPNGTKTRGYLEFVLRAADRATNLVRRIITFARHGAHNTRPMEMVPVVSEAVGLLRATLPSTIEIREHLDEDSGRIFGDPDHIYQAVVNLGANAADAMREEGGVLEVRVEPVPTADALPRPIAIANPGPYVLLTVTDTGCGMEPEVVERIFEPFFTTKDRDRGTGLGLSAVHAIVTRHGGGIRVDSQPGKGTTFRLCFACTSRVAAAPHSETLPEAELRGTERILVVDDEPALVMLAEQQLTRLGYAVTTETDPEEALERFRSCPDCFDLLVTDQTMPHRTGLELANAVKEIRPDLPILLTTGFSDVVTTERAEAAGIDAVILKPYDQRVIAGAIRRAVGARASLVSEPG